MLRGLLLSSAPFCKVSVGAERSHRLPPGYSSGTLGCGCAQAFADKLVEVVAMDDDYVWIHDYHLLARPACLPHLSIMSKSEPWATRWDLS